MEGEDLGNLITWSAAWPSHVVTSPFNSQVMCETDLAFYASYEDCTSASRQLHLAYKAYSGQKTWLRKAAEWQAWKHSVVMQSSCGANAGTIWSCIAYISAIPKQSSFNHGYVFTGRTYLSSGTGFGSLASL